MATDPSAPRPPAPPHITNRCVFFLPGYEPLTPEALHRRFQNGLERFERTWNATATLSAPGVHNGAVSWRVDSGGLNWRVRTDVILLDYSEIVIADFSGPRLRLIWRGLAAVFDFLLSGAAAGYLRASWRYFLFFLFPLILFGVFGTIGLVGAWYAAARGLPWILAALAGLVCVALLVHAASHVLHLSYVLLNWSFAADIVRRRRPEYEAKLDVLARTFAERMDPATDEIVVLGYSLGAVAMMQVVARVLRHEPRIASRSTRINLISVGSSLLKVGLHAGAHEFRAAVSKVIDEPAIYWVEYQSIADFLNFYKTDPVAEMRLAAGDKPIVQIARIREMVTEANYRRMRWNPLRLHQQYVFGNERRYFYDFFMICCGPVPLQRRVESPFEAAVDAFAPDGSYRPRQYRADILPAASAEDR